MIPLFILAHAQPDLGGMAQLSENAFGLFIRSFGFLMLFLFLIYIYYRWNLRQPFTSKHPKLQRKLKVVETKALGNRQFLCVVAYEEEKMLLGAGPNGVSFLCHLPKEALPPEDGTIKKQRKS